MPPARVFENLILSALVGVGGFTASYIRDLTRGIDELNRQMTLVVEKMAMSEQALKDHESRLRELEQHKS